MLEREIKLRFSDPLVAQSAILATGATPLRQRRLQEDSLFDTEDKQLHSRQCTLRIRGDNGENLLTLKGPARQAQMKLREEYETAVEDKQALLKIFEGLGLSVCFRYQKYREEFSFKDVTIALDETPVGTYVEIEGTEKGILEMTRLLGRSSEDFIVDSYRSLFMKHRNDYGISRNDMIFENS